MIRHPPIFTRLTHSFPTRLFSDRNAIEQAKRFAEPELRYDPLTRKTALVSHEPVGVVAAIIPFNGPFAMGVAKTAGALMAGCSVILKPSPEGALHVEVLAEAYAAAGFPAGGVTVLPGDRKRVV